MTQLAWRMIVTLIALVAIAVGQGIGLARFLWTGGALGAWVTAGVLVRPDARQLGFKDPEWAGSLPIVLGIGGLLYWFGYRRERAEGRS